MEIKKIENYGKLKNCLDIIHKAYKKRDEELGYKESQGHSLLTYDELVDMFNTNLQIYGYFLNNDIIGLISYKIKDDYVKIKDFVVLPEHQNKGIGKMLLDFVKEKNDVIKLGMLYDNKKLLNWYQKNDFCIVEIAEYPNSISKVAYLEYRKKGDDSHE